MKNVPKSSGVVRTLRFASIPCFKNNRGDSRAGPEHHMEKVPNLPLGATRNIHPGKRDAGLIVRADSKSLSSAIARLLSDAVLSWRLRANERRWAVKRFSFEAVGGAALRALYE
jgi:hypothetical protein